MAQSNTPEGGRSGWQTRLACRDFGGRPGLVPELGQALTREALELAPVDIVHLRLPHLDALGLRGLRGQGMRLHAFLPRQRPPGSALALAVHLLEALRG